MQFVLCPQGKCFLSAVISTGLTYAAHHYTQIGQEMWKVPLVFLLFRHETYDSFRADFYATRRWPTASLFSDILCKM